MERRELIEVLGAAAVGLTAWGQATARADEKQNEGQQERTGHQQHGPMAKCADICAECATECETCFQHCLSMVLQGMKEHEKSLKLCVDCAEFCATAAKIVARNGALVNLICEACAKACDECGAACEKGSTDPVMQACAKVCKQCATACRDMLKHTGSQDRAN